MMWMLDRLLRRIITQGELTLTGPDGKDRRYGTPHPDLKPVAIRVADAATAGRIARNPALGAGEAFMDGGLTVDNDDIMAMLALIAHNVRWDSLNPTRVALWRAQRLVSRIQQLNNAVRSRRNVAHHYDLSDRLYDLFLDADRQYSCAYFTDPANALEQAQQRMGNAELTLNPADAERFGLAAASQVAFSWQGGHWRLPLRLSAQLKPGLLGLPLGMAGLPTAMSAALISELQEAIA